MGFWSEESSWSSGRMDVPVGGSEGSVKALKKIIIFITWWGSNSWFKCDGWCVRGTLGCFSTALFPCCTIAIEGFRIIVETVTAAIAIIKKIIIARTHNTTSRIRRDSSSWFRCDGWCVRGTLGCFSTALFPCCTIAIQGFQIIVETINAAIAIIIKSIARTHNTTSRK